MQQQRFGDMTKIGIFWVYGGEIFGKAVNVESGIEGVPGMIDCQDNHADVWEIERPWAKISQILAHSEYQDIPRGRVLFLSKQKQSLVYADKSLMNLETKLLISTFFEFNTIDAIWRKDDHYSTSTIEIDELFHDGDY